MLANVAVPAIPLLGLLESPSQVKVKSGGSEQKFEIQGGFITV